MPDAAPKIRDDEQSRGEYHKGKGLCSMLTSLSIQSKRNNHQRKNANGEIVFNHSCFWLEG